MLRPADTFTLSKLHSKKTHTHHTEDRGGEREQNDDLADDPEGSVTTDMSPGFIRSANADGNVWVL